MRMISLIAVLRALAKRLWSGAGKPRASSRSNVSNPSPEPLPETPEDTGSDQEIPQASDTPCETQGDKDGRSDDLPATEPIDDDRHANEPSITLTEVPSDADHPQSGPPMSSSDTNEQLPPSSPDDEPDESIAVAPPIDDADERTPPNSGELRDSGKSDAISEDSADQAESQKTKREPHQIGGMRHQQRGHSGSERRQPARSRPELICRKRAASATWEVILTADIECQMIAVRLENKALDLVGGQCCLPSLTGTLSVSCQGGHEYDIPLFEGEPLIFKLRKNWGGKGHKIDRITSGHFIVIVPSTWERTGRVPVEADGCADLAFRAHYFHRDATVSDEGIDGFHEWSASLAATGIELTGQRIFDDSDDGELFIGDPPSLKSSPGIEWARIGEEVENGWGQNFLAHEQSLPKVLGARDGRFFLRVYDSEVRLLDSVAFRCLRSLKEIHVDGAEYTERTALVPPSTGYAPTEIRLIGADGSTLSPMLPPQAPQAEAPPDVIEVPPHPDADHISCSLASDAHGVNIVIDLPRIWWRLEDGRPDPGEWQDTPLVMTREEFRQYAYANASISLMSGRFGSVHAGIDQPEQSYRRSAEDDRIVIPLVHFADHAQIDRRLNRDAHFKVEWAREIVPLIVISADPIPEIVSFTAEPRRIVAGEEAVLKWATRNARDARVVMDPHAGAVERDGTYTVRPTETTKYTLKVTVSGTHDVSRTVTVTIDSPPGLGGPLVPRVLSHGGGWRKGKGFSSGELRDAGLTVNEAVDRSISIDRRRRTSHRANVDSIRSVLNA